MKNLFEFSATANGLSHIVSRVVKVFVHQHKEDAIIDMGRMYNNLYNGHPIYMCVRENGFDVANRYSVYPIKNNEDFANVRAEVERGLGADVYIKVYADEPRIDILLCKEFDDLNTIQWEMFGLEPMFNVNFVEQFGE